MRHTKHPLEDKCGRVTVCRPLPGLDSCHSGILVGEYGKDRVAKTIVIRERTPAGVVFWTKFGAGVMRVLECNEVRAQLAYSALDEALRRRGLVGVLGWR